MEDKNYFAFKYATQAYDLIIKDIFQTVGFISGGFCPEPCEHTTLQDTDPHMYMKLYELWKCASTVRHIVDQLLDENTFN